MNKKIWNGKIEKDEFVQLQEASAKIMGLKKEADDSSNIENMKNKLVSTIDELGILGFHKFWSDALYKKYKNKASDMEIKLLNQFYGAEDEDDIEYVNDFPLNAFKDVFRDDVDDLTNEEIKIVYDLCFNSGIQKPQPEPKSTVKTTVIKELDDGFKLVLVQDSSGSWYDIYPKERKLVSLEIGLPKILDKGLHIQHRGLTSLEGSPREVGGDFLCQHNQLVALNGAPREVGGNFLCQHNQLVALNGAPVKVGGAFSCGINNLTSLKGAPKEVGKYFWCADNSKQFTEEDVRAVCNVGGDIIVRY